MKNLHYLKKFVVMVLAAMMTLSTFAMPTFAADPVQNVTLKVQGVEKMDDTVKAYQVVEKNSNNEWVMVNGYGSLKKVTVDGKDVDAWVVEGTYNATKKTGVVYDINDPSPEALAALADVVRNNKKTETFEFDKPAADGGDFVKSNQSGKGSYLVIVTPKNPGTVYNPMLVSINPDKNALLADDEANVIQATTANAKKSDIPFEKVVERATHQEEGSTNVPNDSVTGDGLKDTDPATQEDASATDGNFDKVKDGNKGDTAGSTGGGATALDKTTGKVTVSNDGADVEFDEVWFRINTKLPIYGDAYFNDNYTDTDDFKNATFMIKDTLSPGLDLNKGKIEVKVGGTVVAPSATTFEITHTNDKRDFTIKFKPQFLHNKDNRGKAVEVCYSANLNKDHGVNFKEEKNTAELWYTNNPGEAGKNMEDRETYHYTFTINGNLEGDGSKENREVIKIGLDEATGKRVMQETVAYEKTGWKPLAGVKFELRDSDAATGYNVVKNVITDADGILRGMDQIDAGVYYLVETDLGENTQYALDTNAIKIEIKPTLDSKGRMTAYTVSVDDIVVGNYKKEWTGANPKATTVTSSRKTEVKQTVDGVEKVVYTLEDNDAEAADIINSNVGTLPSTGGMGTVLFTIGGAAIMAIALFLLFGGKKKQHQK